MSSRQLLLCGLIGTLSVSSASPRAQAQEHPASSFETGITLYYQNELAGALPLFEAAADSAPDNYEASAYLAETLRRLGRYDEASHRARHVLTRAPCNSFAHTVLGNTYAPQYSSWEAVDVDSAWAHMLAAVECDESFGDAWLFIALEGIRRHDVPMVEKALRSIYESGYLPPGAVAYNRWVLETLPDSAILVTNGDWDTYPALSLQVAEGLRPDVAVVNISLLRLPWYSRAIHDRYGIPIPGYYPDEWVRGSRIVSVWQRMFVHGQLGRPLTSAMSVEGIAPEGSRGHWRLSGPFWRLTASAERPLIDTAAVRIALEVSPAAELGGPATTATDHSPVRAVAGNHFPITTVYIALEYEHVLLESGREADARRVAEWVAQLVLDADIKDGEQRISEFRTHIRER